VRWFAKAAAQGDEEAQANINWILAKKHSDSSK
jgi:TPR repeat protein